MYWLLMLLCLMSGQEVTELVQRLGHPQFVVRQRAQERLYHMPGWRVLPQLRVGARSGDLEVSYRCRMLAETFYQDCLPEGDIPSVYCLAGPAGFDMKTVPEPAFLWAMVCHYYYVKVCKSVGVTSFQFWNVTYEKYATWELVKDMRALGASREDCRKLVSWMQKRHNWVPVAVPRPPDWLFHWPLLTEH